MNTRVNISVEIFLTKSNQHSFITKKRVNDINHFFPKFLNNYGSDFYFVSFGSFQLLDFKLPNKEYGREEMKDNL